ncbi:outer membrane protein V [Polaromonas sp. CF318]|uniref:MipA/OmpV family protein n=1 Tax=Polaromonas sp. CF318 TaxID=1144318 RepID=UPI000270E391|nr:MipA/OmpV family protein [Polaromonas sp. CF318]EJL77250.1 outer membrane protein V [Polaromonas sp. CF318]
MTSRPSRPAAKPAMARAKTGAKPAAARPGATAAKASLPLFSLFLFAALAQQPAAAQPKPAQAEGESSWGLGLGVGMERKPYRDFDNKTRLLPLLSYENQWISVAGLGLDVKLPSAGPVSFRLRARYSMDGYDASDSPFLAGMDERKDGIWLGGAAIWRNDIANLSAELLGDASGNSKGSKFRLMVDRRFQAGSFDITPRLAATRLDDKYVSYYYGVNAAEVRAGRPFYQGGSAVNLEAGLRVGYALAPRQTIFLDLSTTKLGSSIKDSPLVDRSSQSGVRVGYLYRF